MRRAFSQTRKFWKDLKFCRFNFERLTYIYSKTLFLWVLETIVQKVLFWTFGIGNANLGEPTALTGYKFVILCPIAIAELLVGYLGSYVVMASLGALYSVFFWRTIQSRYSGGFSLA